MAYLIFNEQNQLLKIAANDSERDSQNLILSDHSVVSISDSDFLKVRTGVAVVSYNGSNVTFTDISDSSIADENTLKFIWKKWFDLWIDNSVKDYKSTLENFDTSSVTFPLNKTWEQYCNENSITFYHPLQIP